MAIEFQLDVDKVVATVVYIASHAETIPELTPGKLFKLMFLADKYHLVRYGRPITGDRYDAMKDGPVPSRTYDLFKKQVLKEPFTEQAKKLVASLSIDRTYQWPRLSSELRFLDNDQLSKSDIEALDRTIKRFGPLTFPQLRAITHETVAYDKAWSVRGKRDAVPMEFGYFFEEDEDALTGTKEEIIENQILNKVFAKR